MVSRLDVEGNPGFLLDQPLQSYNQQIQINGATAGKIANLINTCLRQNGKPEYSVNPVDEITEWRIQVLLHIAETALAQAN